MTDVGLEVSYLVVRAGRLLVTHSTAGWSVPKASLIFGFDILAAAAVALPGSSGRITTTYMGVVEHAAPGFAPHLLRFFARADIPAHVTLDLSALAPGGETRWADEDEARRLLGNYYKNLPDPFPRDRSATPLPITATTLPDSETGHERGYLSHTRVSARMAARDAQGRVLLVKSRSRDGWVMPGGHYERGETVARCAERETREEAGVSTVTGPLYWLHRIYDTIKDELVLEFIFSGTVTGDHPAAFTANDEDGSRRLVRLFTPKELAELPNVYPPVLRRLPDIPTAPANAYRVIEGTTTWTT